MVEYVSAECGEVPRYAVQRSVTMWCGVLRFGQPHLSTLVTFRGRSFRVLHRAIHSHQSTRFGRPVVYCGHEIAGLAYTSVTNMNRPKLYRTALHQEARQYTTGTHRYNALHHTALKFTTMNAAPPGDEFTHVEPNRTTSDARNVRLCTKFRTPPHHTPTEHVIHA